MLDVKKIRYWVEVLRDDETWRRCSVRHKRLEAVQTLITRSRENYPQTQFRIMAEIRTRRVLSEES